jgi:hypothetical protein
MLVNTFMGRAKTEKNKINALGKTTEFFNGGSGGPQAGEFFVVRTLPSSTRPLAFMPSGAMIARGNTLWPAPQSPTHAILVLKTKIKTKDKRKGVRSCLQKSGIEKRRMGDSKALSKFRFLSTTQET